jgi:hypothetical protein
MDNMEDDSPYFDHGPLTRRELAFDLLPHDEVQELMARLGLDNADTEMFNLEHMDSHVRLRRVDPIMPLIRVLSGLIANTFNQAYLTQSEANGDISREKREAFNRQNYAIIQSSVIAMLAQLLQVGVIAIDPSVVVIGGGS